MYDIPFVRFATPLTVLCLFYWFLFINPPIEQPEGGDRMTPEDAQELRMQALGLMDAKKFDEALDPLLKLHAAAPDSHLYHHDLATVYHALGKFEPEVKMWEMFMQHAPVPGDGCPQISEAYRALGRMDDTMKSVKKCWELETNNADAIFFYAHELERNGQTAQARGLYEKGRALAPEYPDITIGLARTRSAGGNDGDAKTLIDEVLRKRPDNVDALVAAGLIYSRIGQNAAAVKFLLHARELAPAYREIETLMAGVHRNLYSRQSR